MKHYLLLFLTIGLLSCNQTSQQRISDSELPVIDLEKEYPVKRIDIHEIAEVEYIPLETTEESLLQVDVSISTSDNYIIIFDILQHKFFVFNHQGKYIRTIDRFGLGPEEYYGVVHFDADFKKEELYVWDNINYRIYVYGLDGSYKRKFQYPQTVKERFLFEPVVNYDSDYLITFNDTHWPSPVEKSRQEADATPFYLINKTDGSVQNINNRLRIDTPVHQIFQMIKGQNGYYTRAEKFNFPHILKNGDECLLLNNALDTLYSYKNHTLTPIMLRTPSAKNMNPPLLIAPCVYTDTYFIFRVVPMNYEVGKKYDFDVRYAPSYILDRKNKEIFELRLYDSLFDSELDLKDEREVLTMFPTQEFVSTHSPNQAIGRYKPEPLLKKLEGDKLKEKLKEVASRLKEDDNNVVAIFKFK